MDDKIDAKIDNKILMYDTIDDSTGDNIDHKIDKKIFLFISHAEAKLRGIVRIKKILCSACFGSTDSAIEPFFCGSI